MSSTNGGHLIRPENMATRLVKGRERTSGTIRS